MKANIWDSFKYFQDVSTVKLSQITCEMSEITKYLCEIKKGFTNNLH